MKLYSAIRRVKLCSLSRSRCRLEIIIRREISHLKKDEYCVFSMWISRFLKGTEVEWRLGRGRPSGGRDKKRMGTNMVKVHYTHA